MITADGTVLNPTSLGMKNIYIFGTGGFAREVYFLIREINQALPKFNISGFIDRNPSVREIKISKDMIPVYDEYSFFSSEIPSDVCFAIGIGTPQIIYKIKERYTHYDFPNLIHPGVTGFFETIQMGCGNIITAGCRFTLDVQIGSFNIFNLNVTIGHDIIMGSCNVVNPGVNLSGTLKIGDQNLIGTNATVLQNLQMQDNNIIGAGALIRSNLTSKEVVVGNPASSVVQYGKLRNFINKL